MKKTFFAQLMLAILLISPAAALVPVAAHASTSNSTSSTPVYTASIDADSLLVESGDKARLTGTSTAPKLRITITATSTDKVLYKSSTVSVRKGNWHVNVSKRLPDGAYTVNVYQYIKNKKTLILQSTLTVGVPQASLRVSSIALLGGGTTSGGSTVPISYLQVINQSDASTTIAGFWVEQDGTTPVNAIIGFSSVDDKGNNRMSVGGSEGQTPFVNGKAYVPSGAVIAPHQRKLFTIKAQLSASASQYAGTSLMLNISGVDAPATFTTSFPVMGTTWMIR